jgi:hypothetical protein
MPYIAKISGADVIEMRTGTLSDIAEADRANWRVVSDVVPPHDRATQSIAVSGVIVHNDTVSMQYTVMSLPEPMLKSRLRDYAAHVRWEKTQAGVTLPSGARIRTDEASKTKIDQALAMLEKGWVPSIRWKIGPGEYIDLDISGMTGIAQAVATYEQACFAVEEQIVTEIEAGTITTRAQIDTHLLWP